MSDRSGPDAVQWALWAVFTALCLLTAYYFLTGGKPLV